MRLLAVHAKNALAMDRLEVAHIFFSCFAYVR